MGWMSVSVEAVVPSLRLDLLMVGGVLIAPVFVPDGLSDVVRTVRFLPLDMTTPSGPTPATPAAEPHETLIAAPPHD